jgi:MFS family permease
LHVLTYLYTRTQSWLLEKYGLRRGLLFAAVLNCSGTFVRYLGSLGRSFGVVLLGQLFCAITQSITFAAPSNLARTWFPSKIISTVVGLAWASTYLGVALGLFIPPLWLGNANHRNSIPMPGLMFFFFFTAAVIVALYIFAFPKEEPVGLSLRRERSGSISISNICITFKDIFVNKKNRDFVVVIIWWGIMMGCGYALSTELQSIYGHLASDETIGVLGFFQVLCGVIGVYLAGKIASMYPDRKNVINAILYTISTFCLGGTGASIGSQNYIGAATFSCIFFFGCIALNVTALEYATSLNEHSETITPFITSSIMMASVQFFGIILTFTLGLIVEGTDEMPKTMALTKVNTGMTVLCVFLVIGLLLVLYKTFWHEIYDENDYYHQHQNISQKDENEMRSPLKTQMQDGFTDEEILAQGIDTDVDGERGTI